MVLLLWKAVQKVLKKLKIELPCDPEISEVYTQKN